jgi:hypothetical protein
MDHKLTLKLDNRVVERAKTYAREKNTSLSKLIESYLEFLTGDHSAEKNQEITPLVKSISGVFEPDSSLDYKSSYKKHLIKKYSK